MNIHEYQGKELLKRFGVAILDGHVAWTSDEAEAAAAKLPGPVYVVKSQIHAGGRGAGRFADDPGGKGGVRLALSPAEVRAAAEAMIGHTLITKQTGEHGRPVRQCFLNTAGLALQLAVIDFLDFRAGERSSNRWLPPAALKE